MDQFEYVVALMSVITGLGLADVGLSLHRLMKRRATVRWDWLPLAVAAYIAFILIRLWYQLWTVRDSPGVTGLLFFTTLLAETFVLFLAAAAALPDEDDFDGRRIDLGAFYADQRRYIWILFSVFAVGWAGHDFYFTAFLEPFSLPRFGASALVFLPPVVLGAALALVKARRWQVAIFGLLLVHEVVWMILSNF
ncbi:hypothetical protein N0B44_19040 [Roseibacterium beibuensis]|uniref:hypothetical protein n=1 Tax=[Roseibacterium] beibuensis TaxID=1193142 RepID=UPI00217D5476|nr:hypothetical protein [Roseibacterium beibuensis]MCS6625015.1 hypothetical protein [Roseibacterium beibuensis]